MKTKIEILDSCLGEHLKDIQPDVYVIILNAMEEYEKQENNELIRFVNKGLRDCREYIRPTEFTLGEISAFEDVINQIRMTEAKSIKKWLGNPDRPYIEQFRDDLDKIQNEKESNNNDAY